jgi:flagellar biosynthesis protein FliR
VDLQRLASIADLFLTRLDVGWTFLLLATRYMAFLMLVPGLGGGMHGMVFRYPASIALAFVSFNMQHTAAVPTNMGVMVVQMASEILLGGLVAIVPLMIVAGAQTAGHLASGTMGLNGAQLFDPATSTSLSDLARIYSDFAIIMFLLIGGHEISIGALASLNQSVLPGSFILSSSGLEALIGQSSRIFQIGSLIAAPVIVAVLLANFVMGLISKAIPTINIFIISFPLMIGIGLTISILAFPEVARFLVREFERLPDILAAVLS